MEERGFLRSLENLAQVEPHLPISEMLLWMAAGAVNIMDENRDFLRLIIMEGLGGDDAALEQYSRLLDLWENALTTVLRRYEDKGDLHQGAAEDLSRHVIYTILMAFQESLLGRHTDPEASAAERRESLAAFAASALQRLLGTAALPART